MTADRTILIFRSCSEFQSISIYKLRSQSAMAVQLIKFSSTACLKNVLRFGMGIFCDFEFRRFPKFKHLIQRNSTNFNKNLVGLNLLSRSSLYKLNHFAQKRSFHRKGDAFLRSCVLSNGWSFSSRYQSRAHDHVYTRSRSGHTVWIAISTSRR